MILHVYGPRGRCARSRKGHHHDYYYHRHRHRNSRRSSSSSSRRRRHQLHYDFGPTIYRLFTVQLLSLA